MTQLISARKAATMGVLPDGRATAWPSELVDLLHDAGSFRQAVPQALGGLDLPARDRLHTYAAVAEGDVACALILTQHDAACELMAGEPEHSDSQSVLRQCATDRMLVSVGISQLTTSRRGNGGPALRARPVTGGFSLDGVMPWVTAARHAACVVTGAVCENKEEILAIVRAETEGLKPQDDFRLMALEKSGTAEMTCEQLFVPAATVIRGPTENVLKRRSPVKSLTVTFVALGIARRMMQEIASSNMPSSFDESIRRARAALNDWEGSLDEWSARLDDPGVEVPKESLRAQGNHLLSQLASTLMIVSKGSGYVSTHVAQELYREAAFFLVWSAPDGVRSNTLERIWNIS
ncbi:MAG: hypothetical protein ACPGXK_14925 [Phycisphaerae bacterium]